MKKFISISLFISACFLGSCSSYDDERIWQDLNEIEKTIGDYEAQTETLTAQMASLSKVTVRLGWYTCRSLDKPFRAKAGASIGSLCSCLREKCER